MNAKQKLGIGLIIFALIEYLLISFVDLPLSTAIRALSQTQPTIIKFFEAITDFGKSMWYLWPSGLGIVVCALFMRTAALKTEQRTNLAQTGHRLSFFFISIALAGIVTDILKPFLGRARPVEMLREHLYGFRPFHADAVWNSMPSGHATTAAALAASLIVLFPRGKILWLAIGIILAASRSMVNAHYISDVLAGSAVGIGITYLIASRRDQRGMIHRLNGIFPIDKNTGPA